MIDSQYTAYLPDLLICLLRANQVVYRADEAEKIPCPFPLNVHRGPEAGVQRCGDIGGPEIRTRIEIGERFWTLQPNDLAEIAGHVEPEECKDKGLPGSKSA